MVETVRAELDLMAVDVSEHLMASHRPLLDRLGVTTADKLLGLRNGTEVLVAGVRVATQTPPMRGGRRVVFISIDDGTGCVDSVFFHEAQEQAGPAAVRHPAAAHPRHHPPDRAPGNQHQRQHGLGPQPRGDPAVPWQNGCQGPDGRKDTAGFQPALWTGSAETSPSPGWAAELPSGDRSRLAAAARWLASGETDSMDEAGCGPRTPQATKPETLNRRHPCQMPSRSPSSSMAKRPR